MNCGRLLLCTTLVAAWGGFAAEWTIADGKMSDGTWTFAANVRGECAAVGKCLAAPEKPTALDFTKPVTAKGERVRIASLDPRFGHRGPDTQWNAVGGPLAGRVAALSFPEGLEEIGELAFAGCSNATGRLVLPQSLKTMKGAAFARCTGLTIPGDALPAGIQRAEGSVFEFCSFEGEVRLPHVTSIGRRAFRGSNAESIRLGPNFTSIAGGYGAGAFMECPKLRTVIFDPASSVKVEGGFLFNGCKRLGPVVDLGAVNSLLQIQDGGDATSPFRGSPGVRKVVFGTNLTELASCAFGNAKGLEEVHFAGRPPKFALPVLGKVTRPVTTYVHLDPKAPDYAEAKAAWDRFTAGGELKTSGSTWSEAMVGKDFAKRELVLFKEPTLSVSRECDADEGKGTDGFFVVSRAADDPATMPLTFVFEVGGTAKPGWTYCSLWGDERIPAGERSVKIRIIPLDDPETRSDTTVELTLRPYAGGYAIDGAKGSATLKVVNGKTFGGHNRRDAGPWNFIAHMGAGEGRHPGNSKEAITAAVKDGFGMENDVQITEDGRFYLSHDKLKDITGRATFNDALDLVQKGVLYKVDCKCGKAGLDRMLEEINRTGVMKRGGLLAFNFWGKEECQKVVRAAPGVEAWMPIMHYPDRTYPDLVKEADRIIALAKACDCKGISIMWDERTCTKEMFDRINAAGITIDVWTIDDVRTAKKAINNGARWVTTNSPRRLSSELPPANPCNGLVGSRRGTSRATD